MLKKTISIIFGLMVLIQVKAQILGDKVEGTLKSGTMYGMQSHIDVSTPSYETLKGKVYSEIGFASARKSTGNAWGLKGEVSGLSKLYRNSNSGLACAYGGIFHAALNNLSSTANGGAKCMVAGVKGAVSGSIASTSGPTIISAVVGEDYIKSGKTYAGYFDGRVGVNGSLMAEEIIVEDIGADYVFSKGYNLRPIEDVEEFINKNGHLPDVAPASETVKGVDVAEFNTLLLQKIEELTLYMIELKKENVELRSLINKN